METVAPTALQRTNAVEQPVQAANYAQHTYAPEQRPDTITSSFNVYDDSAQQHEQQQETSTYEDLFHQFIHVDDEEQKPEPIRTPNKFAEEARRILAQGDIRQWLTEQTAHMSKKPTPKPDDRGRTHPTKKASIGFSNQNIIHERNSL